MSAVHFITMPKWGLSMETGVVHDWLKDVGDEVHKGDALVEVETNKIASSVEAPFSGVLRKRLATDGEELPVGALLGVVVEGELEESAVEAAIAGFTPPQTLHANEAGAADFEPHKIDVPGYRLRYLRLGTGEETVVLIHGFGGDLDNWQFTREWLSLTRTVYSLDLPGHGESTKTLRRADMDELADAVVAFMEALHVERAHLIGHSMGGAIALDIAQRHPGRVASLTLIASAGLGPDIDQGYITGFATAKSRSALRPQLIKLFGDPSLVTRRLVDDVLKYKRLEGVETALVQLAASEFADGRQRRVFRDQIADLPQRVQVIWGECDAIIPVAHARGLPINAHVLPGRGHMVMLESPPEVNAIIEHFLSAG